MDSRDIGCAHKLSQCMNVHIAMQQYFTQSKVSGGWNIFPSFTMFELWRLPLYSSTSRSCESLTHKYKMVQGVLDPTN